MRKRFRGNSRLFLAAWLIAAGLALGGAAIAEEPPASAPAGPESAPPAETPAEEAPAPVSDAEMAPSEVEETGPPPTSDSEKAQAEGLEFLLPLNQMKFPAEFGTFQRVAIKEYPDRGWSVGYNSDNPRVIFTVYIYAWENKKGDKSNLLKKEMEDVKFAINYYHSDAKLLSEKEGTLDRQGEKVLGREAVYLFRQEFGRSRVPHRSEALLFARGGFFYKYRITYPDAQKEAAGEATVELFERLAWPPLPAQP
jgi:hypothetical protein